MRELWLKLDTANPTHSFKDRVVAVACAKAQELGLTTLACSSTGNLANAVAARAAAEGLEAAVFCPADLEPEKLVATAVYGATALRGGRELRRLLAAHRRALLRARLVGVRQRRAAHVLRRGLEDARLRDRRAARLARRRRRRRRPDRLRGALLPRAPRLRRAPRPRAGRGRPAAAVRRPGGGLLAGSDGLRRGAARRPGAAGDRRALARHRQPGRRRRRRGRGAGVRRRRLRRRRGGGRREHGASWPSGPASSARRPRASRSARCSRRCAGASWAPTTRSCSSSPATGSRRPSPCRDGCSRSRSKRTRTRSWSGSARRSELALTGGAVRPPGQDRG